MSPLRRRTSAPHRLARLACFVCLLAAPLALSAQQPPGAAAPPAPQPTPVLLTATVTDEVGRYISGLRQDDFTVYEGKEMRPITSFSDQDAPASVAILLDVSGSMIDRIKFVKPAVVRFMQQGHDESEYWLGEFDTDLRGIPSWTRSAERLINGLEMIGTRRVKKKGAGATALYDACATMLEQFPTASHARHVILLITDGFDSASHTSFSALRRKLQESDVVLYAIGVLDRGSPSELDVAGQAIMDELATITGGRAFFPATATELTETAERVALELRHRYFIGFAPASAPGAGKWSKVRIKVTSPNKKVKNLFVHSRSGYFAGSP